jgi:glycosyltransferase involved in cell wall biosynthesis
MRILIATDSYPPDVSGSAVFTQRLARGLAARGHEVHLVCASDTGETHTVVEDHVWLHRLWSLPILIHPRVRFTPPPGVPRAVRRLFDAVRPELLHTQDHFTIGRAAVRVAESRRIPVVATNHFLPDNLMPYVPEPLRPPLTKVLWRDFRRVYAAADLLTAPTPTAAQLTQKQVLGRPVEAVSCGVDVRRFRPRPEQAPLARRAFGLPELPTIGYVGRLDAEKRLDELIRAVALLGPDHGAQAVLAGTGTMLGRLRHLAETLGVADRVHFLGFVPDRRLVDVYTAADVFCMPGVAELQSIATLEALACGLPVVLADAVALPHLVSPGQNGHLYRPGDVAALARALATVLASDSGRRAMGAASRTVAERHAIDRTVARFEELYTALLARRH